MSSSLDDPSNLLAPDAVADALECVNFRFVSFRLSRVDLDTDFCIEALQEALQRFGAPAIFNTDQGAQFTSEAFTGMLKKESIKIRGR